MCPEFYPQMTQMNADIRLPIESGFVLICVHLRHLRIEM